MLGSIFDGYFGPPNCWYMTAARNEKAYGYEHYHEKQKEIPKMSEMIEKVAKALAPQSWANLNQPCDTKTNKKKREQSLEFARKAIEAMREPTQDMCIKSGIPVVHGKAVWQDMINAALKE